MEDFHVKLLILGGTVFLGRHLVDAALSAGHEVTLYNRGQHNPELFPEVEKLRGDRAVDLSALEDRRWDAAIDTSGYVPRVVRKSAELLADKVEHYTFISSISVYADLSKPDIDESAPVGVLEDPTVEEVNGETYGPLKVLCEQAVEAAMPGRALTIRPGLIVGPHDPTDRFTYWVERVAEGGDVLAPGRPERRVEFIDVRDLAEWTVKMAEQGRSGTFNATGPNYPLAMGRFVDECVAVSGSGARLVWIDEPFLIERGVAPWSELPLWIPEDDGEHANLLSVDCRKAFIAGLTFRPLADTIRDTLSWASSLPRDRQRRAGLPREREQELLAEWGGTDGNG